MNPLGGHPLILPIPSASLASRTGVIPFSRSCATRFTRLTQEEDSMSNPPYPTNPYGQPEEPSAENAQAQQAYGQPYAQDPYAQ